MSHTEKQGDIFLQSLKLQREKINSEIKNYIDFVRSEERNLDPFLSQALKDIEEVVLSGGKRVRGALLLAGYQAAGGKNMEAIYKASAGVEFIHSYLLVHDDIMDKDELRHGVPTLHTRYQTYAQKYFPHLDATHFGISQAIIFGDMLNAWGNDCIYSVNIEREQVKLAIQKMQAVVYKTGVGQMRDMYYEYLGSATEAQVLSMYEDKTARYTIEGPLHMGVLLAGGSKELMETFSQYALPLGIAFQLQDDILGVFGDAGTTGKMKGSDIDEGKITYLFLRTLALSHTEDSAKMKALYQGTSILEAHEKEWILKQIKESGALEETRALISKNITIAQNVLKEKSSSLDPDTLSFLSGMAEYMLSRKN